MLNSFTGKSLLARVAPASSAGSGKRRTRRIHSLWGALALAAAASGPAHAAVQVTNVQLAGPGTFYTVNVNGENVYDAALLLTIGGQQVFANCDDIYQNISIGQNTSFTSAAFSSAGASDFHGGTYSAAQVGAMSWLLGTGAAIWQAGSAPNEQLDLAALQLASWMIGNPTAVFSNYNADVYSLAQSYITQSAGQSALPSEAVDQLTSGSGVQGQIVLSNMAATAVPEPASWALMLTGFGMVGAAMRKRLGARSHGLTVVYG